MKFQFQKLWKNFWIINLINYVIVFLVQDMINFTRMKIKLMKNLIETGVTAEREIGLKIIEINFRVHLTIGNSQANLVRLLVKDLYLAIDFRLEKKFHHRKKCLVLEKAYVLIILFIVIRRIGA